MLLKQLCGSGESGQMTKYFAIAIGVLVLLLSLAGWGLKSEIGKNANLTEQASQNDKTIERLSAQQAATEKERLRLDSLITQLQDVKQGHEQQSVTAKVIVHQAAVQPTTFGKCSSIVVPSDILNKLFDTTSDRNTSRETISAAEFNARLHNPKPTGG